MASGLEALFERMAWLEAAGHWMQQGDFAKAKKCMDKLDQIEAANKAASVDATMGGNDG